MLQGDLFQRLSLDETLKRVVNIYSEGFLVFLKITALFFGAQTIVWAIICHFFLRIMAKDIDTDDPTWISNHLGVYLSTVGINMIVTTAFAAIAEGGMVRAVAELYVDRPPNWLLCLKLALPKSLALILAALLVFLGSTVGYFLLLIPGLYLAVSWFVFAPAIVLENASITGSLRRSRNLVSGSWCYVFCTFLILMSFMLIIQMIWQLIVLGARGNSAAVLFSVWKGMLLSLPTLLFQPIFAIMKTTMYFNLRVEKEGLNADVLHRELASLGGGGGDSMDSAAAMSTDYRRVSLMEDDKADNDEPAAAMEAALGSQ